MLQRHSLPHTPGPKTPASPPHNPHPRASPLKLRKSPPPLPHRMQAHGRLHLRHMQVHCHRHPVTARKIHPRRQLATCKARRDDIPTWHTRPTTTPTCHTQAPPWRHLNTECKAPLPPTSRDANLPRRQHAAQDPTTTPQRQHVAQDPATTPPPTRYAKWSSGGNGGGGGQRDDGGEDGSDVRHSYYLRLYIFYLCNKLILFLYFVRLKL